MLLLGLKMNVYREEIARCFPLGKSRTTQPEGEAVTCLRCVLGFVLFELEHLEEHASFGRLTCSFSVKSKQ